MVSLARWRFRRRRPPRPSRSWASILRRRTRSPSDPRPGRCRSWPGRCRLGLTAFGGPAAHVALLRIELVERRRWLDDGGVPRPGRCRQSHPGSDLDRARHAHRVSTRRVGLWSSPVSFVLVGRHRRCALPGRTSRRHTTRGRARARRRGPGRHRHHRPEPAGSIGRTALRTARSRHRRGGGRRGVGRRAGDRPAPRARRRQRGCRRRGRRAGPHARSGGRVRPGRLPVGASSEARRQRAGGPRGGHRAGRRHALGDLPRVPADRRRPVRERLPARRPAAGRARRAPRLDHGRELVDAVAVGQATPGPLFSTATFIGYLLDGPVGAAAATLGIFLPAFVAVAISIPLLARSEARPRSARSSTASTPRRSACSPWRRTASGLTSSMMSSRWSSRSLRSCACRGASDRSGSSRQGPRWPWPSGHRRLRVSPCG